MSADAMRPIFGDPITSWRRWFAWRPIRAVDGGLCWLRHVQWRAIRVHEYLDRGGGEIWFQYRLVADVPIPISTAPKDGTTIMLFFPPPGIGHWVEGSWAGDQWEAYGPTTGFAGHPSHWMPAIPEPE